jgi:hypothetical protein
MLKISKRSDFPPNSLPWGFGVTPTTTEAQLTGETYFDMPVYIRTWEGYINSGGNSVANFFPASSYVFSVYGDIKNNGGISIPIPCNYYENSYFRVINDNRELCLEAGSDYVNWYARLVIKYAKA